MSSFFSADLHNSHAPRAAESATLCPACAATAAWVRAKRLMTRSEAELYLALSHDQVQSLVNTRQITVIRIKGEDRFDSRELDLFVDTYKKTAQRRA
jgi:hypothetical protein